MNRLGWLILFLLVAAAALLGLMIRFGDNETDFMPGSTAAPSDIGEGLVIPVAGIKAGALADTWGDSRGGGSRGHNAIDIMAPRGTPVVAAAPGVVEKLFDSQQGGRTIYVRTRDRRTIHYYAHLDSYRDGLVEGQAVRTGDVIGTVGFSGNASPDGPHLHFEVKRMREGETWHEGEAINPYPLLAGKEAGR